ncbi:unnamed protein product [Angiostrongylus costaricensis]|uniref:Reverse transcriptase domain-containing protein n=1 Tax=Angiostrongylus costaricensis TaxID=334426 RepID=A0A0R3PSH2_ANGCS|nr:unnamed protein product [Angiostrongylus costaricensis]
MPPLEWDNMGVKVDGRQLHHLRFADDIVLMTPKTSQAEGVLDDFDKACGKIGLRLNLTETMLMKNGLVSHAPFTLNGTNISECSNYVYLGREINMMNDLAPELSRRKRAPWGAFKSIEDVVRRTKNTRLRAHFSDSAVLPALTCVLETWSLRKQDERSLSVIEGAVERTTLGVSRSTQVRHRIRSSDPLQRSKIEDSVLDSKQIRCARHVMRMNDNRWTRAVSEWIRRDVKRTIGRPPTRWSELLAKSL